mmetsp:Transcript_69232/g.200560  ORF Transcript_69232/g.200560 Transcript_69232/m.200560 type:complete len:262 (+) Transcript_69232:726-1511(+)
MLVQGPPILGIQCPSGEGHVTCQQFEQHTAERPNVALWSKHSSPNFRSHGCRSATHRLAGRIAQIKHLGNAEVDNDGMRFCVLRIFFQEHDVFIFQVFVDDTLAVAICHGFGALPCDRAYPIFRYAHALRPFEDHLLQAAACERIENQINAGGSFVPFVQSHEVRVVQLHHDHDFPLNIFDGQPHIGLARGFHHALVAGAFVPTQISCAERPRTQLLQADIIIPHLSPFLRHKNVSTQQCGTIESESPQRCYEQLIELVAA